MKNLLIMQETEFSGAISMYPSTKQLLCTHVDKLVTSNFQICFPAPYLILHAKYSHMLNMPLGRTSPGLPYLFYLSVLLTLIVPLEVSGSTCFFQPSTYNTGPRGGPTIRTASANSVEFCGIRPRMYIKDLLC